MAPSTNGSSSTPQALVPHKTYWINSADLHFLVENVQYKVHRYFFERESAYWRGKLSLPASPGAVKLGSSDDAIVLEDVTPEAFDKLLWVFYNPRYSLYDAPVDDYISILILAHKWGFAQVKAFAVRELQKSHLSDIDRIVVYHANDVDRNLLIPCFAALCAREHPLTLQEGMKLGMETTLVIASAREYVRAQKAADGSRTPITPTVNGEELETVIRDLFRIAQPPTDLTNPSLSSTANGDAAQAASSSGSRRILNSSGRMPRAPQSLPLPPKPLEPTVVDTPLPPPTPKESSLTDTPAPTPRKADAVESASKRGEEGGSKLSSQQGKLLKKKAEETAKRKSEEAAAIKREEAVKQKALEEKERERKALEEMEAKKKEEARIFEEAEAQRKLEQARLKEVEESRLKAIEEARLKELEETRLKELEETRLRELEEIRLKELEEIRLKELEEIRLKEMEEARLKAIEEARLRELEETRLKELEEIRLRELEEARLKAVEEARIKAEEDAERLRIEEAERQRVAQAAADRKREEEAAQRKIEEEAAAAEAARVAAEEAKRKEQEEAARKRTMEEAATKKREQEEAAQRKADEEAAAEAARIAAEQESARIAAEQESARIAAEQEAEARRLEEVAAKKRDEEEAARVTAEQEAESQRLQDIEAQRLADEIEAKRLVDEAEAKRISEEAEVKRLADEIEAKRLADDEAKRKEQAEQAKQEEAKSATKAAPEPAKEGEDGEAKLSKTQRKKKKKGKKSTAKDDDKESFQDVATPVTKPIELVDAGPLVDIKTLVETPPTFTAEPLAQTTQSDELVDLSAPADVEPHAQAPVVAEPSPIPASLFDEPESTPKGKKPARSNTVADSDLSDAYQSAQSGPPTPTPEQQEFKGGPAPNVPPKPASGSWNPNQQPQFPGAVPMPDGQWHGNNPMSPQAQGFRNNGPPAPTSPQAGRSTPTPRASRGSLQERLAGTASKVSKTLGHKSSNSGQKKEKEGSWGWF